MAKDLRIDTPYMEKSSFQKAFHNTQSSSSNTHTKTSKYPSHYAEGRDRAASIDAVKHVPDGEIFHRVSSQIQL